MLSNLLFDIRFHIATFDEEVWYLFYKHFDDFKLFTCRSIPLFTQLFTKKILFNDRIEYTLLGYLHCSSGPAIIYHSGIKIWYQHGKLHRDGGPAIIYAKGSQFWYQHGERHRDGGPAVIYDDGLQHWYQHDKLHRDDGPAMIFANGDQFWYQHGKMLINDN